MFSVHTTNIKTQQSSIILDLCLRKPRSENYRDAIDFEFEKLRFHNVFRSHEHEKPLLSNSFGSNSKSGFEKLRFRDRLV